MERIGVNFKHIAFLSRDTIAAVPMKWTNASRGE